MVLVATIIGSVLTYYFTIRLTRNNNMLLRKKQYIEEVCIKIIVHLDNITKDNQVVDKSILKDAVAFIEKEYEDNYLLVPEENKEMLESLKNSIETNFNVSRSFKIYCSIKEHIEEQINEYKKEENIIHERKNVKYNWAILTVVFIALVTGIIEIAIGICGIWGIDGVRIQLVNAWDREIYRVGLFFRDETDILINILFGVVCLAVAVFLLYKCNEETK